MRKTLLTLLLSWIALTTLGQNIYGVIEENGVTYSIEGDYAFAYSEGAAIGDITIPKYVYPNGIEIPVKYVTNFGPGVENLIIEAELEYFQTNSYHTPNLRSIIFTEGSNLTGLFSNLSDFSQLELIVFPKNASFGSLSDGFVENCINLTEIVLPDNLSMIGRNAFANTPSLHQINLSDGIEFIEAGAFKDSGLERIILPKQLRKIGAGCFKNCQALEEVVFSPCLTEISAGAFSETPNLNTCVFLSPQPPVITRDILNWGWIERGEAPFGSMPTLYVPSMYSENYYYYWIGREYFDQVNTYYECSDDWKSNYWCIDDDFPESYYFFEDYVKREEPITWNLGPNSKIRLDYNFNTFWTKEIKFQNDFTREESKSAQMIVDDVPQQVDMHMSSIYKIDKDKWYFISLPFDVNVDDIHLKARGYDHYSNDQLIFLDVKRGDEWSPFNFAVRYYDGEIRALENGTGNSWQDIEPGTLIKAGTAIIVQAGSLEPSYNDEDRINIEFEIIFPAIGDLSETIFANPWGESKEVELFDYYNHNNYTSEENRGWNFISNPFPSFYDMRRAYPYSDTGYYYGEIEGVITVYDNKECTYKTYSLQDEDVFLAPCEPFFIQTNGSINGIRFNEDGRTFGNPLDEDPDYSKRKAREREGRAIFNIKLTANGHNDETRVVFNKQASLDYEVSRDATKFFSENLSVPQIYTISENNTSLAINERPEGSVKIGYYAPKAGEMTMSFPTVEGVAFLHDAVTGKTTLLKEGEEYRFETEKAGRNNNRFTLDVQQSETTGIQDINEATEAPDIKISANGISIEDARGLQLTISTIDGIVIINRTISSESEYITLSKGCYCITIGNNSTKCIIK